jgi:Ser/Thr protein kinase RdoA (MazF antagonist)
VVGSSLRVREIIAQHIGWLGQFAGELHRSAAPDGLGQRDWVRWDDIETWNDTFSDHAKGKDKAQIVHELEEAVTSFKEALAQLPDEQFRDAGVLDKWLRPSACITCENMLG